MAFDGVTVSAIVSELKKNLTGGRIYKIYQPEVDELCLVVKNRTEQGNTTSRLVISADASLPLLYLTDQTKENPTTAPNFCMLLRKHIQNARILSVTQPDFERIVEMEFEHLDEMGDLCRKKLIVDRIFQPYIGASLGIGIPHRKTLLDHDPAGIDLRLGLNRFQIL